MGEWRYSSHEFLTLAPDGGEWSVSHFTPSERSPVMQCIGGWVGQCGLRPQPSNLHPIAVMNLLSLLPAVHCEKTKNIKAISYFLMQKHRILLLVTAIKKLPYPQLSGSYLLHLHICEAVKP
jgi:hypothetical protein